MSIALSSSDLGTLPRVLELLASPLDHASVDRWRSAVNRELRELLHADSAGFLLPVSSGLMLYSEEHDPGELARYPDYPPPPLIDGTPLWERMRREGVTTLANVYGASYEMYLNSTYYREYAAANGAHDTLTAAVPLGGTGARGLAALHFWHERPDGRLFGDREVALLRLLFPAFRAGVEAQLRWGEQRSELLGTLDTLGQAVLVCDASGQVAHQTPALGELLMADPEASVLRGEMLALASMLRSGAHSRAASGGVPGCPFALEVRTATALYGLRASLYRGAAPSAAALILVALDRRSPLPRSEGELREAFGLTRAEVRVALLIGRGSSNAEVAEALTISPYTARRHTERILLKLRVRSRSEVAAKLFR